MDEQFTPTVNIQPMLTRFDKVILVIATLWTLFMVIGAAVGGGDATDAVAIFDSACAGVWVAGKALGWAIH